MWVIPVGLLLILVAVFSVGMWSGPRSNKPRSDRGYVSVNNTAANSQQGPTVDAITQAGLGATPNSFSADANRESAKGLDNAKG